MQVPVIRTCLATLLASLLSVSGAVAGDSERKAVVQTPLDDSWRFSLSLPGWVVWMRGDTGIGNAISHVDLGPGDIVPRIDMAADVRLEAHKGRWSVLGEFLYLSLSDGIGMGGVVKKLDFQVDQNMADLGVAWRIVEADRGFLDLIAGVRYTNLYQKVAVQANDERIDALAGKLALAGTLARGVVARELRALRAEDPTVPIAPLDAADAARAAARIARIKGTTAERKERISRVLHDALSRTVSRLDDWWDPYIGLRARYNLSGPFYLTAKGDIGGFGVGSDLSWTAEAAFGVQVSPRVYSELGYRALGVDYRQDNLVVDTITHGLQLTTGITF